MLLKASGGQCLYLAKRTGLAVTTVSGLSVVHQQYTSSRTTVADIGECAFLARLRYPLCYLWKITSNAICIEQLVHLKKQNLNKIVRHIVEENVFQKQKASL